jgi:hypothetical protein
MGKSPAPEVSAPPQQEHNMKKIIIAALAVACIPAMASAQKSFGLPSDGGKKNGFGSEETTVTTVTAEETQGRSGKPAQDNNNQGTAETTTTTVVVTEETGPRGVLKNDNTDNPNFDEQIIAVDTTSAETDAPGNSKPR